MHNPHIDWKTERIRFAGTPKNSVRPERQPEGQPEVVEVQEILGEALKCIWWWGEQVGVLYVCPREVREVGTLTKGQETAKPPIQEIENVPKEYWDFQDVFQERGKGQLPEHQPWDHKISLKSGTQPAFKPIYPLSEKEHEALQEYIDKNLEWGYIRPSTSPAGYPILFVPKKNGKLQLCVDYCQLNDITIKNCYLLPLISELQDRLRKARYFTKLDLHKGYYLVWMKEGEEWKTAFRTCLGHFEYTVMPFGLTNAPATFQSLVNNTLRDYLDIFCMAYLDNILIYSDTLEEHKEHVKKVLRALQDRKLSVAPEKCEWHTQKVEFLGFVITPGHVEMDERKLAAIREWPTPTSVKEVQSFLGFANFYWKFIWNYSKIAEPLIQLTRKKQSFEWGEEQQAAFEKLKQKFCEEPVLKIYDPEKPAILETDASEPPQSIQAAKAWWWAVVLDMMSIKDWRKKGGRGKPTFL